MAMTLRTDTDLDRALALIAKTEGISKQEAARRAIMAHAKLIEHRSDVAAATEEVIARWGDVLDRLGKA